MGIYSVAVEISLNIKSFFRVAAEFGLPEPTTEDGIFYEMKANQVKEWMAHYHSEAFNAYSSHHRYANDADYILCMKVIEQHASSYIYKLTQAAPEGQERRAFLRKGSKKYRFAFC